MVIGNIKDLVANNIIHSDVKNAKMKVLISSENGWDDYVMRVLEVDKEGFTPKHSHPWPHINYIISGEGVLMIDGKDNHVKSGSYAFVPANTLHQFRNVGNEMFRFICIVPKEGHR